MLLGKKEKQHPRNISHFENESTFKKEPRFGDEISLQRLCKVKSSYKYQKSELASETNQTKTLITVPKFGFSL